jgi:hypothetical protein
MNDQASEFGRFARRFPGLTKIAASLSPEMKDKGASARR